jgi:excisionase family DNA binding protein
MNHMRELKKPTAVFWNVEQVAEYLGLDVDTVYSGRASTNEIPRVKLGRAVRWKRSDVEAFAERKHRQATDRLEGRRRFPLAG